MVEKEADRLMFCGKTWNQGSKGGEELAHVDGLLASWGHSDGVWAKSHAKDKSGI